MNGKLPSVLIAIFIASCTPQKPSEEFQMALDMNEELLGMEAETRSIFESMEQVVARDTSLNIYASELKNLNSKLSTWEKSMVAVGAEEDHQSHYHSHGHMAKAGLSDAELLQLQKNLRRDLEALSDEVASLVEKMMDK